MSAPAASEHCARRVAWALWALIIPLQAVHFALLALNGRSFDTFSSRIAEVLIVLLAGTCALLITSNRPRNPIGWLFFVSAYTGLAFAIAGEYAYRALVHDPGSLPAAETVAWVREWSWVGLFAAVTPALVLFPDGRPLSRRWTVVAWLALPGLAGMAAADAINPGPLDEAAYLDNPYGIEGPVSTAVEVAAYAFGLFVLVPATALALIVRYRRAAQDERQQLKWVALAAAVFAVVFGPILGTAEALSAADSPFVQDVLPSLALAGLPVATTIAILRYRLYDVDLIINRTLVYGALTITTVASYAALVVGFGWAVRAVFDEASNELAVAATTLIVAAMFQPARRRIQSLVDRRFYRAHYDAARILQEFQDRLRHETDLESLRHELLNVTNEAIRPAHASLWLRPAEERS